MAGVITPQKTELGWVMEIPAEMAAILKVEPGSVAVIYPKREGTFETEILRPPSAELKEDFQRLFSKYRETCEELKRIGD